MLNWRDTRNPEGGGSEVYVESIARGLSDRGHDVTIFCAAHADSPAREVVAGVTYVRAGTKLTVYPQALSHLRRGKLGTPDVIVDVQNGVPFASPLARLGVPVVVLVHHVHREQWPIVYGPVRSRIGWILESRIGPRVYRNSRYVAVSERTRADLIELGVTADRVSIVRNGTESPPAVSRSRSAVPRIVVVSRLVPHKQVEHVIDAARLLRDSIPQLSQLQVDVVGDGWWNENVRAYADRAGANNYVTFHGFVSEKTKHDLIASGWVLALPSLKEGWGVVVMEAAVHGVPSVAYRSAGGVTESIVDGHTGLLVEGGTVEFSRALGTLLCDEGLRTRMGAAAAVRSRSFRWDHSVTQFERLLKESAGQPVADQIVIEPRTIHPAHVHHTDDSPSTFVI